MGPLLEGPEYGHVDAVTDVVITDRGLVMSAALDGALCIFAVGKPRESLKKIERAHVQGIISVAHDAINNWFITGGFDGIVKVWSADAKPVATFSGATDDVTRVAYVPLTHCYWLVDRFGHVQAYDARTPAAVTEFVQESNDLVGHGIKDLWVQAHTDSVFASTQDRGLIQYR
jgi:WD40 repeat protein